MKLMINKKLIAKEIIILWFILLPLFLGFLLMMINNSVVKHRINNQLEVIKIENSRIDSLNWNKKLLVSVIDVSINSFESKKDSIERLNSKKEYFVNNYPELKGFTQHLDEKMFNLIFLLGIPDARKDSIMGSKDFWNIYLENIDFIYSRDSLFLNSTINTVTFTEFITKIKSAIDYVVNFKIIDTERRIVSAESNIQRYQLKKFEKSEIRKIMLYIIIGYLFLIYPVRLIIISLIWSFKTLKAK
jgi:hypothetical protein